MKKFTEDEISDIMEICSEMADNLGWGHEEDYFEITKRDAEYDNVMAPLVGYQVNVEQDGDHRTDGQFCDYTFNFISPEGLKTTLRTEMCLQVGWNYHSYVPGMNVIIK